MESGLYKNKFLYIFHIHYTNYFLVFKNQQNISFF